MTVILVDTSGFFVTVSLKINDECGSSIIYPAERSVNERLLESIDYLLSISNVKIGNVDEFYIITGPGSFTGIRVGIAALLGITLSLYKPLNGITTVDAAALAMGMSNVSIAMKLPAKEYLFRQYDFKNHLYSDYTLLQDRDISKDIFILDNHNNNINIASCISHKCFLDFKRTYEPFYVKKFGENKMLEDVVL
mgnify:CR=1 FL=1